MTDQDLYGQAKSLLLNKYGSLPEAGDTPGSYKSRVDAFRRKQQEDEAKIAQQAAEDAAQEAAKAERERASAIKSVASEDAKNTKTFLEDTYPAAKIEAETRKAEIEDAWAKDEKAAQPSWRGIVPGDPAAAARTQAHKAAWEKTQAEIDAWDQGAKELETNTRKLSAKADALKDIEYAKDKAKVAGEPTEGDRILNGTMRKRLHPQNPQDYRDSYAEEMARQGYELPTLAQPAAQTAPVAQQPEQAGPPAPANSKALQSLALEQSVAETLQKEVLAGRDAIRNRSIKDAIAPGQWASMDAKQKRAFIEQFNAKKAEDMAAYDAQQAGMSAERKASIEDAQGQAQESDALKAIGQDFGKRANAAYVSFGQGGASLIGSAASFTSTLLKPVAPDAAETVQQFADGFRAYYDERIPEDMKGEFSTKLANTLGQIAGFIIPGGTVAKGAQLAMAAPKAAMATKAAYALMGVMMNGGNSYYEAKKNGASEPVAWGKFLVDSGLGSIEGFVGTEKLLLSGANKLTGGALGRIFTAQLAGATGEAVEEIIQNSASDVYDKFFMPENAQKSWSKIGMDTADAATQAFIGSLIFTAAATPIVRGNARQTAIRQLSDLDKNEVETRHMTPTAVAEIAAETLNGKNDKVIAIRKQIDDIDKALSDARLPEQDNVDAKGNGTPGRSTLMAERAKLEAQLKEEEITVDAVELAADMTDGTTGRFAENESEISRLKKEIEVAVPPKESFFKPTDWEHVADLQDQLNSRLRYRSALYRGEHQTPETVEQFRQTIAAAGDISKFVNARISPDGNDKLNGSNQRSIAIAIWKLANGRPISAADLSLQSSLGGGKIFAFDKKTNTAHIVNPNTLASLEKYKTDLGEAWAKNQVIAAYEKTKHPIPVLSETGKQEQAGPVQDQQAPEGGVSGQTNRPGNGAVQTRKAVPGIYRVGAKSTVTGAFAPGISADVTANSEADAIQKVSTGEVEMPTAPGNHGWAVQQIVQEPQEAQYAQPEPEADANAAASDAIQKAKDATDSIVKPLLPLFKGVRYEIGPKNTDSGMYYDTGTGDLVVNVTNLDPKNKERTRRVAIEEAIHAALVSAKVDAAGIWKSIKDEKAREALFSAYETLRYNGTDSANGHEFLRLFFQKKIDLTPDGRLIWDENGNLKTSEEAATENASLIAKVRVALKKIIDYIDGILNSIPDTDAAKEVQRARDVLKERFEYLDSLNAPPKAEAEKAQEPQEQPEPAAEQPTPVEQSPDLEPKAQEFAPEPPRGDIAKLERKLSEKAFQSVNVPTERLAAYIQGMDESQPAKTKPLSDKDVAALYEYYYAKGDQARMAILDGIMAQRGQEEQGSESEQLDEDISDAFKRVISGNIRISGNPKQEQGTIDTIVDGYDHLTKAQQKRIRDVFVFTEQDADRLGIQKQHARVYDANDMADVPPLDILRQGFTQEEQGITFDTVDEMLQALDSWVSTGNANVSNGAIFSQAIKSDPFPDIERPTFRLRSQFAKPAAADPAELQEADFLNRDEYDNHITDYYRKAKAISKTSWEPIPEDYASRVPVAILDTRDEAIKWMDVYPVRSGFPGYDKQQHGKGMRFFDSFTPMAPEPVQLESGKWAVVASHWQKTSTESGESSKTLPMAPLDLQVGQWMIDRFKGLHGREIAQLRLVDTANLLPSEDLVPTNTEGRGDDSKLYRKWLEEGRTPPPINVVETDKGTLRVTDGHRRYYAHKEAGMPVLAWVWPAMDHPNGDRINGGKGPVMRVGMTFEATRNAMAIASQAIPASTTSQSTTTDKAAKTIARELKRILPHVKLTNTRGGIWIAASDKEVNGIPETTAGGDGYTGVSVTVSKEDGKVSANVSDINSGKRKSGMGRKMLEAIAKAGVPIYHGTDWSGGFWMHIKKNYPELLNRPELRGELGNARWGVKKVEGGYQITNIEQGKADIDSTIYESEAEATEAATSYNQGFNGSRGKIFTPDMMPPLMSQSPDRNYESMDFVPPFKSPRGDILSYSWVNDGRRSDWNQAKTNPITGREIVHHFKIRSPKGDVSTVSLETAMGMLSSDQRDRINKRIKAEMQRRQDAAAGQGFLFSQGPTAPAFYSLLEQAINAKIKGKFASPEQLKAIANNPQEVKAEEVKWSGIVPKIDELAKANGGKVPMDELRTWMADEGSVEFREVVLGMDQRKNATRGFAKLSDELMQTHGVRLGVGKAWDDIITKDQYGKTVQTPAGIESVIQQAKAFSWTLNGSGDNTPKYAQYTLPGGTNYREVVLAMPPKSSMDFKTWLENLGTTEEKWNALTQYEKESKRQAYENGKRYDKSQNYTSSHFTDIPNYVAHMRLNDRTDAEGRPGTLIEEIQSDRHQKGREHGYSNDPKMTDAQAARLAELEALYEANPSKIEPYRDEFLSLRELANPATKPVPDAPHRKDWSIAMFKRALRDAIQAGHEWIGWTTGETQAERYDLSKQIKEVSYYWKTGDATGQLVAVDLNGKTVMNERDIAPDKIEDYIGKDVAKKLMEAPDNDGMRHLAGIDLKVGGEGMRGFYDQILPKEVQAYIKQWKAEDGSRPQVERATIIAVADPSNKGHGIYEGDPMPETPIWRVNITPAMREGIQAKGQALFSQSATPDERAQSAGQLLMEFAPVAAPAIAQDQPKTIEPLTPEQSQMVADNLGLAYMVANKAAARGWDREEATQEASIGLTKAVRSFDPARGVKFSTYAVPVIQNHMTTIGRKQVRAQARNGGSLDEQISNDDETTTRKDMLAGDIATQQPDQEGLATFRRLAATLPANVRQIMEEYGSGQTYEAIAQKRQVSRQAIQQAIQKGTRRLVERLKEAGITSSRDIFPDTSKDTPTIARGARKEATGVEDEANTEMQDAREPDAQPEQETLSSQAGRAAYDTVTEDQARAELGRAQPLDAMVKTRLGWSTIGDLQAGDEIEDPEGGWQFIKAVYPQGNLPVSRIELESGKATEASKDHLWRYKDRESDEDNMVTTTASLMEGFRIPAMA